MSPQVRVERMGPATVEDLPRYHSLVERINEVANCWRSTGRLMGPANVGDVTNWHFSHSFRLIFLNIYEHYLSDSIL